jgi:hypothetical protein
MTSKQSEFQEFVYRVSEEWIEWLTRAARLILNVATDSIDKTVVSAAQKAVKEAAVVCFLGFSYHPDNLGRLGIPGTLRTDTFQHIFGSAYSLARGEQDIAKSKLAPGRTELIRFGESTQDCLAVLREFPVLG